jgi:hypothetical protein
MAKVVNKNPNASHKVNGVTFERRNGFMVSVDHVDGDELDHLRQIPGFEILEDGPAKQMALPPAGATSDAPNGSDGSDGPGESGQANGDDAAAAGAAVEGASNAAGASAEFAAAANANGDGTAAAKPAVEKAAAAPKAAALKATAKAEKKKTK